MVHSSLHRFQGCEGFVDTGITSGSFLPSLPTPRDRGTVAKAASRKPQCSPEVDRPQATARELLPHLTLSTVPSHPFPVRGSGNRSCRQTTRSAPGRPLLPRPALLPPPLQRRALTATSRTRVRDCGKFQTACRALRRKKGPALSKRRGSTPQRKRRRHRNPRWQGQPSHLPDPHAG